ncbi:MAG: hypothetical protein AABX88_00845 [Nanoarchaeota archaeon]
MNIKVSYGIHYFKTETKEYYRETHPIKITSSIIEEISSSDEEMRVLPRGFDFVKIKEKELNGLKIVYVDKNTRSEL